MRTIESVIDNIKQNNRRANGIFGQTYVVDNLLETLCDEILEIHKVEARPKGKWLKNEGHDKRDNFYTCSECGRSINIICGESLTDYPFCHCGADMKGENDDDA